MKKYRELFLLLAVLFLALFFRLYRINDVPPSPSLDEVSLGWNAYSILKTGADEFGTKFPILLRAYDDWRPALYVYLIIPFLKVFGLTAAAVRLPSVILSLVTIMVTFFLTKKLFSNSRLALIASFLLAISPWHIYISRLGHEVNAGLAFSALGILMLLNNSLLAAAFFIALSFYTYQSQKILMPLMALSAVLIFRQEFFRQKKKILLAIFLGIIVITPLIKSSFSAAGLTRFNATSIFANRPDLYQKSALRLHRDFQNNNLLGKLVDNRRIALTGEIFRNYFSHFNPGWLFFNESEESHKIPGLGLLYLWELPFFALGLLFLVTGRFRKETKYFVFAWIIISPLAAAFTTQAPHAMRFFTFLPIPQVLSALGLEYFLVWSKKRKRRLKIFCWGLALVIVSGLGYLFHQYFTNFPLEQSESFQYPLNKAIAYAIQNESKYRKIVITNQSQGSQSYMFYLFLSHYDPFLYLENGGTESGGYAVAHTINRYFFRPVVWKKEIEEPGVLYIGNSFDFPPNTHILETFSSLDGEISLQAVEGPKSPQ